MQEKLLKKELKIDEFMRRNVVINDFLQGEPRSIHNLTNDTRKFNRELLKATL